MLMRGSTSTEESERRLSSFGGGAFVFVGDVADDFFEDVFGGDEAAGAAVFIEDDGDVDMLGAEFAEEVAEGLDAGDEVSGAEEAAEFHLGVVAGGAPGDVEEGEEVLGVEDAEDVIEGVFEDGDAGEAVFEDVVAGVEDGGVDVEGDDVGAGGHDLADLEVAEGDDALDHFLLFDVDGAFGGALGDDGEDFLGDFFGGGFGFLAEGDAVAGEAADDFVEDFQDADEGPGDEVGEAEQGPGAGEERFAGILGPGLGDGDGEDHHDGDGEEDGPAEDGEGVGCGVVAVEAEEVDADGDDGGDVGDEAEDGGGEGEIEAGAEDGIEGAGAAADDEGFFELDAGDGAEGVGEGGEEEGGEGGEEKDPDEEGGGHGALRDFLIFDFLIF